LDCTGERRAIGVLDPLTEHVSEIVTFSLREYYSLTRVFGSATVRANRAVRGKLDPLLAGERQDVPRSAVQLTFDADVEAFRAEFVAFLDEHLPAVIDSADALDRPRSSSHMPEWARRWQRLLFDNGWLLPGNPPEFGGRNATLLQQYAHLQEMGRRRIYHSFNPQGVGIIAASLLSYGTAEQKHRWAVPILRAEITASLGMSEPGAGSDLASLKTRAVLDGDHFVVNGQKVWTSGAHDADVLLTFVRTDPAAPKHKGISALLIPTDSPGLVRRPFASVCDRDDVDFNEVFFTDVRVPAENLLGELNGGWRVATGSLGHERVMLWMGYADLLHQLTVDFGPSGTLQRDHYATLVMDAQALRLLGSAALARAARGEEDVPAQSVLKLLGSEAMQRACEDALTAEGPDGLALRGVTAPSAPLDLDSHYGSRFDRYTRTFAATIAGGTSDIQRNIIAGRILGLPRN
jgi:alkylation response protein AidB-like acyl-CoA dehydrogenase